MVGVAVMCIGVSVAAQAWSVVWRRDSEEELIFRANQYVDAILLYKKDHGGQFPTNLEDLMEIGPRQVRYIRKLFKDPVNPDGQWGLLYLMPTGNAIYDPVAAQRAAEESAGGGWGGVGGSGVGGDDDLAGSRAARGSSAGSSPSPGFGGVGAGGITPIGNVDPMGTGAPAGGGIGSLMTATQGGKGGGGGLGSRPGGIPGIQNPGLAAGAIPGRPASVAGHPGAGAFSGALPPPKPKSSSFDDDSPSEPPIGWPIVGVISRATGRINENTFKIYKGHEKVNEWQFHAFDRTAEMPQAPAATLPGGSAPAFIGPGFGGRGPIGGIGSGAPGPGPGGGGRNRTRGQQPFGGDSKGPGGQWPNQPGGDQ
jgi:hypothetical protein